MNISAADEAAIRHLIARNAHVVDNREVDAIVALFTEDGLFNLGDREFRGAAAIHDFFTTSFAVSTTVGRHHVFSPELKAESAFRITAVSDFQHVKKTEAGWMLNRVARYEDVFERQADGSWRIKARRVIFA